MGCNELIKILEAERKDLKKDIERIKWLQSERERHDIGWRLAEYYFVRYHLDSWAEGYRRCYCRFVCGNPCDDGGND